MPYLLYVYVIGSLAVLDAVWLFSMGSHYRRWLGHLFAPTFNFVPAVLFYLVYAVGIVYFVVLPATRAGSTALHTFLVGAFFGLVAFAAYDLTNQATMRSWPIQVTIIDMVWGAVLTGLSATIALVIFNHFK